MALIIDLKNLVEARIAELRKEIRNLSEVLSKQDPFVMIKERSVQNHKIKTIQVKIDMADKALKYNISFYEAMIFAMK